MLEKSIKNLMEIIDLSEDEIKTNNKNVTAILDLEDLKSLKEILDYMRQQEVDFTTVYLKGVYDGKDKATAELTTTKEKLAEDAFKENIKLKKELEKKELLIQKIDRECFKYEDRVEELAEMESSNQYNENYYTLRGKYKLAKVIRGEIAAYENI